MLADTVLVVHFAIVLFIAAGLPLIYVGGACGWRWVRDRRWRIVHAGAIVFVASEALVGVACPLTVWEDALRGRESGPGFIERWVHAVMFYDVPPWVFTVGYVGFAVLVGLTWFVVRPRRSGKGRPVD